MCIRDSGCIAVINNSRQAVYGYDQRVEAFGSKGMASDANDLLNTTTVPVSYTHLDDTLLAVNLGDGVLILRLHGNIRNLAQTDRAACRKRDQSVLNIIRCV